MIHLISKNRNCNLQFYSRPKLFLFFHQQGHVVETAIEIGTADAIGVGTEGAIEIVEGGTGHIRATDVVIRAIGTVIDVGIRGTAIVTVIGVGNSLIQFFNKFSARLIPIHSFKN